MKKLFFLFLYASILSACHDSPTKNESSGLGLMGGNKGYYEEDFDEDVYASEENEKSDYLSSGSGTFTVNVTDANGSTYHWNTDNTGKDVPAAKQKKEIEKKIIKRADVGYEVEDYGAEINRIKTLVSKFDGYISSENEENSSYRIGNRLTIRVPAAGLDKFLDELTSGPEKLDYKRVTAQDVTEEYVDIHARLKTKKEVEARFVEILKKAKTIEEILHVENQLRTIREEIEAKEGRLKYLQNQVGLSTIDLNVYQTLDYKYDPPKSKSFWERMARSLDQGWKGLLSFIVGITNLWPFWLILIGTFFLLRRIIKRVRSKK